MRTIPFVVIALTWSIATAHAADKDDQTPIVPSLFSIATPVVAADAAGDTDWMLPAIEFGPTRRGAVLPSLYVSLAALQAMDAYTTVTGVRRGAVEVNTLLSGLATNGSAMWAMKAGVTAGSILAAERLWKRHRRAQAIAVMAVSNGMMAMVAARNYSVLRSVR